MGLRVIAIEITITLKVAERQVSWRSFGCGQQDKENRDTVLLPESLACRE